MLTANTNLQLFIGRTALLEAHANQLADSLDIQRHERILGQNALIRVELQKFSGVIAREAHRHLRQIVGPEREELSNPGNFVSRHRGAGNFNHGPDQVIDLGFVPVHDLDRYAVDHVRLILEFVNMPDQRNHNLRINLLEAVQKIQSYGMEVTAGLIVGNDDDPEDIHDRIFDFCQQGGIPMAMVSPLNAMRGSLLYERLKSEGRLLGDFSGNNTHAAGVNFIPKGKTIEQVMGDYHSLLDT